MRVAVGLSGGVDSSVAALLLKRAGHEVTAITMRLWRPGGRYRGGAEGSCFGPGEEENIARSAATARRLGIRHEVYDVGELYEREVIDYFRDTSLAGRTPNPCVRCNELVKFGLLPRLAREAGLSFDVFATGHYARILTVGSRRALARAADAAKDQSYFLCRLSQEQLAATCFPLGELTKDDVRRLAAEAGLEAAHRPDSQDFYAGHAHELIGADDCAGNIVDRGGRILGRHPGYWHFTVGQRRGLGVGGGTPYFVLDVNPCRNEVIVGTREEAVTDRFRVTDVVWGAIPPTGVPVTCRVKVRSAGAPKGPVTFYGDRCELAVPLAGVAPGQSAVFYDAADRVLAGAFIV